MRKHKKITCNTLMYCTYIPTNRRIFQKNPLHYLNKIQNIGFHLKNYISNFLTSGI